MKTKSFYFVFLFLFFATVFSSCKKTETENPQPFNPIKISFEEYSLEGTACQWKNLPYNNTVIVINNKEELEKYVLGEEDTFPDIDFANHSLLLASGRPYNRVLDAIVNDLEQYTSDKYKLDVELTLSDTAAHEFWVKALIVKKIHHESKVRVNLSAQEKEIVYPIDIPYLEYSLEGTQCYLLKILNSGDLDKCSIKQINSNEELEKYIRCNGDSYPDIDFSKYKLLFAFGVQSGTGFKATLSSLKLTDEQIIEMRVSTESVNFFQVLNSWSFPILVNKSFSKYPVVIYVEHTNL